MTAPSENRFVRENEFYAELWSTVGWGHSDPNEDERRRAEVILELIRMSKVGDQILETGPKEQSPLSIAQPVDDPTYSVIDLGCGRGWLTNLLAREMMGGRITGIDPVAAAIERAQALFPHLDFLVSDAPQALARFGPGSINLVVTSEVIEHIPDAEKPMYLRTIYALLKRGGAMVLTTPRGETWRGWQKWHPHGQPIEQWIREADLPELCRAAGFVVQAQRRIFVPGSAHSWLSRVVTSRRFNRLMNRFPRANLFSSLRHRCAVYQAALCVREEAPCLLP